MRLSKNVMCKTKIINGYIYSLYNLFFFGIEILQHDAKNTHTREQAQLGIEKSHFSIFPSYDLMGGVFLLFVPPFAPLFKNDEIWTSILLCQLMKCCPSLFQTNEKMWKMKAILLYFKQKKRCDWRLVA